MTALYIDGEYAVSVDTMALLSSGKKEGSEITDDELYELIENSNLSRAKEKALHLIEYRARTRKEIEDKLMPLFGEKACEAAVERLEELGLIDDESYAREYAETLLNQKHLSRRSAEYKMMQKGIDRELIGEILDEVENDPTEHIRILLATKYARKLDDEKSRAKTVQSLLSMGYRWSDIDEAMNEYMEELD